MTIGAVATAPGLAWSFALPLNKALWTSSYATFTAGLAALFLASSLWVIDLSGWQRPVYPFVVLGHERARALRALGARRQDADAPQGDVDRRQRDRHHTYAYRAWIEPLFASPYNASLASRESSCSTAFWVMYKRGIFVKA